MSDFIFSTEEVIKHYRSGYEIMTVVDRASIKVREGDIAVITGKAGCGKSTFLHICAGLCSANYGTVIIRGTDILKLNTDELARFRGIHTGIIFPKHNLIEKLSAKENIVMPAFLVGRLKYNYEEHYRKLVKLLHIEEIENLPVSKLTAAQCQRACAARALINRPQVLFADEPVSELDSTEAQEFLDLLYKTAKVLGLTVVYTARDVTSAIRHDCEFSMDNGFIKPILA